MKAHVFEGIRDIVYDESGIRLHEGKQMLLAHRLGKRLRTLKLADEEAYLEYLRTSRAKEVVHLIEAVSTNYTFFNREGEHFTFLADYLREAVREERRKFRIWCAASSTGEEPYTIAMTVRKVLSEKPMFVETKILATDISAEVLARAQEAIYDEERTKRLPRNYQEYVGPVHGQPGKVRVRKHVRDMVLFKRLNLSRLPYPMKKPFDVIFCRNVMIYFDQDMRRRVVQGLHDKLVPGGYLMVSKSESLRGLSTDFLQVAPSIYRKAG